MVSVRNIAPEDDLPPLVVTPFHQLAFLVIDADGPSLESIGALLESVSVTSVHRAPNVSAAVSILADRRGKIDCIIGGHCAEGMAGLGLLQRIRAGGRNAVVPRNMRFILATAHPNKELVRAAAQLDVDGVISKPTDKNSLLKVIHLAFNRTVRLKSAPDYARITLPRDDERATIGN